VNRLWLRAGCAGLVAFTVSCGGAPQGPAAASPSAAAQHLAFTVLAEPSFGRLQIAAQPLPVLAPLTQDKNGNAATVDGGRVQIYAPNVAFASGGVGYPSGCNTMSPQVMFADVEVFSGFKEQLRNVYVKITSVSGGQTFCGAKAAVGSFGGSLNPNLWLYLYAPLDLGHHAFSLPRRSLKWGIQLPDNGAYWFDGELWAEIIPAPPTIKAPADGATFRGEPATTQVSFEWTEDLTANGSTPAGTVVPRPRGGGSEVTIWRCNAATTTNTFDATACGATPVYGPTIVTSLAYAGVFPTGSWYQWTIRPAFTLPGDTSKTVGTQLITRSFRTLFP
jgi:hypothetical protein